MRPAPPLPKGAINAAGDGKPAPFCAAESRSVYVGKPYVPVRAAQPNAIAIAKPKGMQYHAIPSKIHALTLVSGREAMTKTKPPLSLNVR